MKIKILSVLLSIIMILVSIGIGNLVSKTEAQSTPANDLSNLQASTYFGTSVNDTVDTIELLGNDQFIVAGTHITNNANMMGFIKVFDTNLKEINSFTSFPSSFSSNIYIHDLDINQATNGQNMITTDIYVSGTMFENDPFNQTGFIMKLDDSLTVIDYGFMSTGYVEAIDFPFVAGFKDNKTWAAYYNENDLTNPISEASLQNNDVVIKQILKIGNEAYGVGSHASGGALVPIPYDSISGISIGTPSTQVSSAIQFIYDIDYDNITDTIYLSGRINDPQPTSPSAAILGVDTTNLSVIYDEYFYRSINSDTWSVQVGSDGFIYMGGNISTTTQGNDVYVQVMNKELTSVEASKTLGGGLKDTLTTLTLDKDGDIIFAGYTFSSDYPVTNSSFSQAGYDGFITILSSTNPCTTPNSGPWTISIDCTLDQTTSFSGDILIESTGSLTLTNNMQLDVDLENQKIEIENGGTLEIEDGSKLE